MAQIHKKNLYLLDGWEIFHPCSPASLGDVFQAVVLRPFHTDKRSSVAQLTEVQPLLPQKSRQQMTVLTVSPYGR